MTRRSLRSHPGRESATGFFSVAREGVHGAAVCVVVLLAATSVSSAARPLATIEVTAEPLSEAEQRAPAAAVTVVDTRRPATEQKTVAETLAESVGVQVRRFGGLGSFSTVSIRGSAANQVQVFFDGIPLSRARNDTVNLADLPIESLERIEIYRGAVPPEFGTGALNGVVNLVPRHPATTPTYEVATAYGSFATRKVVLSHTRAIGELALLGFATYQGTDGDFRFHDDNGTPANPNDDDEVARVNNHFDSSQGLFRVSAPLGDTFEVDLTSELFYKSQGVPGIDADQAERTSLENLRSLSFLRARAPALLDGHLDVSATIFGTFEREIFTDRLHELFGINQDVRTQTLDVGGQQSGTLFLRGGHQLLWSADVSFEQLDRFNDLPGAMLEQDPPRERLRAGVATQGRLAVLSERFLLLPTLRYAHLRDQSTRTLPAGQPVPGGAETAHHDLFSPSIGIRIEPLSWLSLRGNLGRYQRAPNFSELFGNRGFVRGFRELRPEEGINRDLGVTARLAGGAHVEHLRVEYTYFNNDSDDLIIFLQNPQATLVPRNVGQARVRGHEVSAHLEALRHLAIDVNYTHQEARNLSGSQRGNRLPLRPESELFTRLELSGERGRLFYELNFVSGNFVDPSNFNEIASRDTHALGLSVTPIDGLEVGFEARNLTDSRIRDVAGFPLPGRTFSGSVRLRM